MATDIALILAVANEQSISYGLEKINVDMFLLSICRCNCQAKNLISKFVDPLLIEENIHQLYATTRLDSTLYKEDLDLAEDLEKLQMASMVEFHNHRTNETEPNSVYFLLAILNQTEDTLSKSLLNKYSVTYDNVLQYLKTLGKTEDIKPDTIIKPKRKETILDHYGVCLNELAVKHKLKPVIGRDKEIKRLAEILSRKEKNNPILIGEPGVGKTAIVEGLVEQIHSKSISSFLQNKIIYALDINRLVAGTKYRGQFEDRLKVIIDKLKEDPNIIIFIDEIHMMIGAGDSEAGLDMSNVLKPELARGTVQVIGATTLKEYKKIEKDGALERRFQKIVINEPTKEETLFILKNLKSYYGDFHKVEYTDEILQDCIDLTAKYLPNRVFPDKATDLMDEVGSFVKLSRIIDTKVIKKFDDIIAYLQINLDAAVKAQDFTLASSIKKDREAALKQKDEELVNSLGQLNTRITKLDLINTVSVISNIPVSQINVSEKDRIQTLENNLKNTVIGQDRAIELLCRSFRRHLVGLNDPKQPIGKFIFFGSSGCGKTFLVEQLAKYMFGSEDLIIKLDMSEFMEKHTVSRLIGSPPGYAQSDQGGQLTEKVKHFPYSIILLDEIEKAHKDVFNIFLQIFDKGVLTDSSGYKVNFKNTIIIATSNLGTSFSNNPIGFGNEAVAYDSKIKEVVNKFFAKEFINRLDATIIFNQLSQDDILKIMDLYLDELIDKLKDYNLTIDIKKEVKLFLMQKGYSKEYGVRELKRTIRTYIEDRITDEILLGNIKINDSIIINYSNNIITIAKNEATK